MSSVIQRNGFKVEVTDNNEVFVQGVKVYPSGTYDMNKDAVSKKVDIGGLIRGLKMEKDTVVKGDVTGNIEVTGNNVTLKIEGDMTGNIMGAETVEVGGDFTGMRI